MAEILGLVSSGAGLASLAMQLLGSAQKLKAFYKNAKHAPKKLEDVSFDLETLSLMLREFERYRQVGPDRIDIILARCIRRFQEEVQIIEAMVDKLGERLKRSRFRGRLVAAFDDPELQSVLVDLERAKGNLWLAYQMYMEYVSTANTQRCLCGTDLRSCHRSHEAQEHRQAILAQLDRLHSSASTLEQTPRPLSLVLEAANVSQTQTHDTDGAATGTSRTMSHSRAVRRANKRFSHNWKSTYSIAMPQWLAGQVWSVVMSRAPCGLTITLRTWRTITWDSPAVRHCREGDLLSLQKMIADGDVLPRDRTKTGTTLFYVAAETGHIDICSFLVHQCCLSTDLEYIDQSFAGLSFIVRANWDKEPQTPRKLYRLMLDNVLIDHDFDEDRPEVASVPRWWLGCPDNEILKILLRDQLLSSTGTALFEPEQILCLEAYDVIDFSSAEVMLALFNITWSTSGLRRISEKIQTYLLRLAACRLFFFLWAWQLSESHEHPPLMKEWRLLITDLVVASAEAAEEVVEMFVKDFKYGGLFHRAVQLLPWRVSVDTLRGYVRLWVASLHAAGMDLTKYGERVRKRWKTNPFMDDHMDGSPSSWAHTELIQIHDVVFGPSPLDWSLNIRIAYGISVWKKSALPGAWQTSPGTSTLKIRELLCTDLQGLGWAKVQTIVIGNVVVDIGHLGSVQPPCAYHEKGSAESEQCHSRFAAPNGDQPGSVIPGDLHMSSSHRERGHEHQYGRYREAP